MVIMTPWSVREPILNLILSNAIWLGVLGWAKSVATSWAATGSP